MVKQSADRLSDEQEMLVQVRPARFSVFSVVTAIILDQCVWMMHFADDLKEYPKRLVFVE